MIKRWDAFARFLDDGRICLTSNAAKRALRCIPLGRKAWLFCGSDRGGKRAAVIYTLIQTAKLNNIDPWLGPPMSSPALPTTAQIGSIDTCRGMGRSAQKLSPRNPACGAASITPRLSPDGYAAPVPARWSHGRRTSPS